MVDQQQTIAILGSSPLAALLAGLLAADHSRNVLWVRDSRRQSLLPRDIATSVAPITRPETWRLLQATTAETSRRLARLDGAMLERSDALFYARESYPRTALLHMRHTATAYGHAVESDVSNGAEGRLALRMRDALSLGRARFWKAILPWLERSGVTFVEDSIAVAPARGRVGDVVCDRIVLADDTAIRTHVDPAEIAAFGRETAYRSVLTAPVGPLPAPLIFNADADVQIHQRANGTLEIVARDDAHAASARIAASLAGGVDPQRSGEARFVALATRDNAPVLAPLRRSRAIALAGFGPTGLFLAPAIARHLCDAAHPEEAAWLMARTLGRPGTGIAEFGPEREATP
jgi:hypothetical protein